jgi:lysozyme
MTTTASKLIIDVSANQVHPISWSKVKKAGVAGVILKATQGTGYVNPDFEEDLKGCNDAKLPVMAYHFAMFEDVAAEVAAFEKVAGARARVLDIETSTNLAWSNTFLKALQDKYQFAHDETMLYGSKSSIPRKGLISLLWVADYGVKSVGVPCAMWQFTENGKVAGIANEVDQSYWMGTSAQFDAFFSVK